MVHCHHQLPADAREEMQSQLEFFGWLPSQSSLALPPVPPYHRPPDHHERSSLFVLALPQTHISYAGRHAAPSLSGLASTQLDATVYSGSFATVAPPFPAAWVAAGGGTAAPPRSPTTVTAPASARARRSTILPPITTARMPIAPVPSFPTTTTAAIWLWRPRERRLIRVAVRRHVGICARILVHRRQPTPMHPLARASTVHSLLVNRIIMQE